MLNFSRYGQNFIAILFLAFIPFFVKAQDGSSFKFVKNKKRNRVSIPFKLVNNLMVIPLSINGSDTLNFILDTGVSKTIMTNLYFEGSMMLNRAKDVKLSGLGDGEPIPAIISKENIIKMDGIVGSNQEIYVLLEDIFFLSSSMGMQIHGLIGYSIFKNFVVKIDYTKKHITLYDPKEFSYKGKGTHFPISIERYKPYLEATVHQIDSTNKEQKTEVKLLVDTGASHALSLYDYRDDRIIIPDKSFRSYLGRGLNGDIYGKIGRLKEFHLGVYNFENPVATYPDEDAIAIAMKLSDRSGSIGSEILRRFHVIIDYSRHEIILKRNGFFRSRFIYNMSGVEVGTPVPGLNYYKVIHVRENSPAQKAGIKRGDDILTVNGSAVGQMDLNDLIQLFHGKPRRKLKIKVLRDGEPKKFMMTLKELI